MTTNRVIQLIIAIALLGLGRQLFWLFLGGLGFIAGFTFMRQFDLLTDQTWVLAVAVGFGFLGAFLAIFLQKVAIGAAGFIAGGLLTIQLTLMFQPELQQIAWLLYLGGGIVGTILLYLLFDWTLVVLSSLIGASLVTEVVKLPIAHELGILIGLTIVGILFQAKLLNREK